MTNSNYAPAGYFSVNGELIPTEQQKLILAANEETIALREELDATKKELHAAEEEINTLKTETETIRTEQKTLTETLRESIDSLSPAPEPGEPWRSNANYIEGKDNCTVDGVLYDCLKTGRNHYPPDSPDWWAVRVEVKIIVWDDADSGHPFVIDDITSHNGITWRCKKDHTKSQVRVPLDGSQWWEAQYEKRTTI